MVVPRPGRSPEVRTSRWREVRAACFAIDSGGTGDWTLQSKAYLGTYNQVAEVEIDEHSC